MRNAIIMFVALAMLTSVLATPAEKFCTDTDGIDVWTPGYVENEKGSDMDDCDGASENLKEKYCDDDKIKVKNIKCTDFGAVCISAQGADYCACPEGTVKYEGYCLSIADDDDDDDDDDDEDPQDPSVPEFTFIGGALAAGAVGAYALKRRK